MPMQCPCQSDRLYADCCQPYHNGKATASAETLMRSRYSAYVLKDGAYLYKSWSKQTRPSKKSLKEDNDTQWLGLEILRTEYGTALDTTGVVEFIARYQAPNGAAELHETSRFVRENGKWVYLDGDY